ncbi:hypothetical protein ACFQRC_03160 [Enterovirga sp. GCM10030262]|uniref:hypothetical protein n=1 Tax=Enterovirga sp. GCM10030262 TaxID=3273391 RepID=UPI0036229FC0
MPSSLGLTGDLDDNDLIEDVEEAFDVQFSKEKLKQCWTVGDLFKLIEAQLPGARSIESCATAMCFYRLRRALQPRIVTELRPKTPIEGLGSLSVRKLHWIIKHECGLRPPPQYVSLWGCIALLLFVALPMGMLTVGWPWWMAAASVIPPVALYRVAPIRLPGSVKTVGDLVRMVSSRSIGKLYQQGARLGSSEAWAAFRDVLSDHSLLQKEAITPDTLILAPRKAVS